MEADVLRPQGGLAIKLHVLIMGDLRYRYKTFARLFSAYGSSCKESFSIGIETSPLSRENVGSHSFSTLHEENVTKHNTQPPSRPPSGRSTSFVSHLSAGITYRS